MVYHQIPFRKTHDLADLGTNYAAADPGMEPPIT